jgi:uncharacterized protein YbbC (DUF1343 family)
MLLDNLFLLMGKLKYYIFILLLLVMQSCGRENSVKPANTEAALVLGDDQLMGEDIDLIKGKRLGLVVNKASTLSNSVSLVDTLAKIKGININAVFAPEHGFYISFSAGKSVSDTQAGTIPVYSLYGKNKKPTPEMLRNIDLVIFDLQDVGSRFYTYISTLYYVIQVATENNIPLIILDRPNPLGGVKVEGPVLNPDMESFVGIAPIPVIYGMTTGELANLFAGEYINSSNYRSLKIIKMKNWKRDSYFNDYLLKWNAPSPNIPDPETAFLYPATAFLEGTNVSEGRGTDKPFKLIGAPFIKPNDLISELDTLQHPGVRIKPVSFIPVSTPGKSERPKYENITCYGIRLILEDPGYFKPVDFSIKLLYTLHKLYPEKLKFKADHFDKLYGTGTVREMLNSDKTPDQIIESWQPDLSGFLKIRTQYLLY